jgi:hypothetical protein
MQLETRPMQLETRPMQLEGVAVVVSMPTMPGEGDA